jgi:hypothetical protein
MAPGLVKQADRVNEEIRPPMDKTKELHNLWHHRLDTERSRDA